MAETGGAGAGVVGGRGLASDLARWRPFGGAGL